MTPAGRGRADGRPAAQVPKRHNSPLYRCVYTAGLYAMSGSGFFPRGLYALPDASIGVYGPEAVRRFLDNLDLPADEKEETLRFMAEESTPETLLKKGLLTGIIPPDRIRDAIVDYLALEQ